MRASARQTSPNQLRMWSRAELVDRLTPASSAADSDGADPGPAARQDDQDQAVYRP